MDPTLKRKLVTVAAWATVVLCIGIPPAVGVGIGLRIIEPGLWMPPLILGCIVGLWRVARWLDSDDPSDDTDDDDHKPGGPVATAVRAVEEFLADWRL